MLAACGVQVLLARGRGGRAAAAVLVVGLFVDLWPKPLPVAAVAVPTWVTAPGDLPAAGAVIDLTDTGSGRTLYYQTVHHRPIASGYIWRVPTSVMRVDEELARAVAGRDWAAVRYRFGFRHLVLPARGGRPVRGVVYDGPDRRILDLAAVVR